MHSPTIADSMGIIYCTPLSCPAAHRYLSHVNTWLHVHWRHHGDKYSKRVRGSEHLTCCYILHLLQLPFLVQAYVVLLLLLIFFLLLSTSILLSYSRNTIETFPRPYPSPQPHFFLAIHFRIFEATLVSIEAHLYSLPDTCV